MYSSRNGTRFLECKGGEKVGERGSIQRKDVQLSQRQTFSQEGRNRFRTVQIQCIIRQVQHCQP